MGKTLVISSYWEKQTQKNVFTIALSVSRDDAEEAAAQLLKWWKTLLFWMSISLNQYVTTFTAKAGMTKAKTIENIRQALTEILQFLQTNGFYTVCGYSGEKGPVGLYQIDDSLFLMNEDCFKELSTQLKRLKPIRIIVRKKMFLLEQ